MEYMVVKGSIELRPDFDHGLLDNRICQSLEEIEFLNDEGIVTSRIKRDRMWILGEGLMQEAEANKLVAIVRSITCFSYCTCRVDVQRIRWELNIIIGNEYVEPSLLESDM